MDNDCEHQHTCNAGVSKLEVLPNGNIIPCPAFKGLAEKYPEVFILGNIRDTTLAEALKHGQRIPYLLAFRRWKAWSTKFLDHCVGCPTCGEPDAVCDEGGRLLIGTLQAKDRFEGEKEKLSGRKRDD